MIDLHAHILPGVDDGPKHMDSALKMLKLAASDGIREIVATPHVLGGIDRQQNDFLIAKFEQLADEAERNGIDIAIHLAAEIYINPEIESIIDYPCCSFDGKGRFILVEFSMNELPFGYETILRKLVKKEIIPIVAHPERNYQVSRNIDYARRIVDTGAVLQLNAGSLLGVFGRRIKKASYKLLENDLVYIVASDAHNPRSRPPILSKAKSQLTKLVGEDIAEDLILNNPEFILSANAISVNSEANRLSDNNSEP